MIGATNSSVTAPVVRQGFEQIRLLQAQRNAEQAQAVARELQEQAGAAQQRAAVAQETARDLSVAADRAQTVAGRAKAGVATLRALGNTVQRAERSLDTVLAALAPAPDDAVSEAAAAPASAGTVTSAATVNLQGQAIGQLISTSA